MKHRMITPVRGLCIAVLAVLVLAGSTNLSASTIHIWKGERTGYFEGYYFPVSIGASRNPTPTGRYTVRKKVINYWSKKYDRAMPYAVFFTDAHAIHAGDLYSSSKGCIRVDHPTAEWLFHSARSGDTRVVVHP